MKKMVYVTAAAASLLFTACSDPAGAPGSPKSGTLASVISISRLSSGDAKFWASGALKKYNIDTNSVYPYFSLTDSIAAVKVHYYTTDLSGSLTEASGMVLVPLTANAVPLLSIQHGIQTLKRDVPSSGVYLNSKNEKTMTAEYVVGLLTSTSGFMTVIPDYLGLGDSPGTHPFCHKALSASAVCDLMRCADDVVQDLKSKGYLSSSMRLNGKNFLFGHSQGGYSTIAALELLEKEYRSELPAAACAASAGPYALRSMADTVLHSDTMANNLYAPYLMKMISETENISAEEIFGPVQAAKTASAFSGLTEIEEASRMLPVTTSELFAPSFLSDYRSGTGTAKKCLDAVSRHDLLSMRFSSPIRLYCSDSDMMIPSFNAVKADSAWKANGSSSVEIQKVSGTHTLSFLPAFTSAFTWFKSL